MNGSIYTGATGLLAFQQSIDVASNNIANVNTAGFKSDTVSFSDLMYQSGIGYGSSMNDLLKDFSQGTLTPSDSEYDFAIEGDGFFTLEDPDTNKIYYTRTGQFSADNQNNLVNGTGFLVMGIKPEVTGDIISSGYENNITSTVIETDDSIATWNTYTTDYKVDAKRIELVLENLDIVEAYSANDDGTATTDQLDILANNPDFAVDNPDLITTYQTYTAQINSLVSMQSGDNNKSIDSLINDVDAIINNYSNALKSYSISPDGVSEAVVKAEATVQYPVSGSDPYSLEIVVDGVKIEQLFDGSVENTLNLFSDQISSLSGITSSIDTTTGILSIQSLISGETMSVAQSKLNENSIPITKIAAEGSGLSLVDALYTDLETALAKVGGDAKSNKSVINDSVSGALPLESIVLDLDALGLSSILEEKIVGGDPLAIASYPEIQSDNGYIYLVDGEAKFLVGQLLPKTFTENRDLNPEGDNLYSQGLDQNDPIYIEGLSSVEGKYLEQSNADLSDALVNLMMWQKAFEANSKTVATSDELLQTALALKTK